MKRLVSIIAAAWLLIAAPVSAHKLMDAGESADVANSALIVTPSIDWNKLSERPGKDTERWTLDGELLNDVIFFAIEDDEPLLREVDKNDRPLPRFRSDMLTIDIPDLLASTHRIVGNVSVFSTTSVEPARLGGRDGVQFSYEFLGSDELRRKGEAFAAIVDGKLYMITYEAPEIFYFDRDQEKFRQLVMSARFDD